MFALVARHICSADAGLVGFAVLIIIILTQVVFASLFDGEPQLPERLELLQQFFSIFRFSMQCKPTALTRHPTCELVRLGIHLFHLVTPPAWV